MSFGMYQASIPGFIKTLNNLTAILDKAERYVTERKIAPEVLLTWRLAPDMFPLTRQIQLTSDFAKGAAARLAGKEVPKYPDEEKHFRRAQGAHRQDAEIRRRLHRRRTSTAQRPATSRLRSAGKTSTSRAKPISCISCCRTSISTPRPPTTSSGISASRSASAIFSACDDGAGQAVVPELSESRSRNAINRPAPKPPICAM